MDSLFLHLETEFRKKNDTKFTYHQDYLIISNFYYYFKIQRINENYYQYIIFWKLGLLSIVFNKPYKTMQNILKEMTDYSSKNKISISKLHYHGN